ncbi:MerR family transcriptional regulator [Streptomyces sp. NRRL F-5135]|uniref:MerR family transcriptional regulator n=1 Tax=Streptomyces sp. NRRL F-5135 TaxID=1463858 RepID=UPI0004C6C657|nr:MerR family transcriptional regulator [Streptomyces sp. NRRL F-5135]
MDEHYTTAEAAAQATQWRRLVSAGAAAVTPATVRQWARRGHLAPAGLTPGGHPLYAHADLARAERATRGRALRLVGIPEPPRQ